MMDVSLEEEERLGIAAFHVLKQQYNRRFLPDNHRVRLSLQACSTSAIDHFVQAYSSC